MSIESMKQALEALESVTRHFTRAPSTLRDSEVRGEAHKAITALRQAIEQAEQAQPVVWMYQDKSTHEVRFQKHMSAFVDHSRTSEVPLYGEPLANHELQCVCGAVWCGDEMVHLPNKTPPRQPLTDAEIDAVYASCKYGSVTEFARAIEAKLKEKNNA